jgi:hypothetical protein
MQEVKIQFYNFRVDDGFQKLDSINPYELEKEFNLKTIIFDVKQKFNIEYIDSPECVFIFFSHSILDVSRSLHRFALFNEINQQLTNNITKKVILYCEDMDWCRHVDDEKEVEDNFQEFFGNNLSNILITLANVNWCFKWERLNVTYNLGCLTYVLNKNIEQSEKYELTNVNRTKKLFTVNNEPRGTRLYFYKYIIDNNLLDNFDCSFFFKFQHKQQITWDNVEGGGDTLQALKDVFPVITFDNENNDDYYKKIKIINFPKVTDSYVDVVIETSLFDKNFYSFSEKSFKSIIAKKPFVILGSNSTYKGLKELGFQTYDDLIDVRQLEDGFKEWQFKERIDYFFKSVHKLCDKDLEYYKNYYILNKDKIEYNYNHLKQLLENQYIEFKNLIL